MILQLLCVVGLAVGYSECSVVSAPAGGDDFSDDDELMDYQAAKDREFTDSSK